MMYSARGLRRDLLNGGFSSTGVLESNPPFFAQKYLCDKRDMGNKHEEKVLELEDTPKILRLLKPVAKTLMKVGGIDEVTFHPVEKGHDASHNPVLITQLDSGDILVEFSFSVIGMTDEEVIKLFS